MSLSPLIDAMFHSTSRAPRVATIKGNHGSTRPAFRIVVAVRDVLCDGCVGRRTGMSAGGDSTGSASEADSDSDMAAPRWRATASSTGAFSCRYYRVAAREHLSRSTPNPLLRSNVRAICRLSRKHGR